MPPAQPSHIAIIGAGIGGLAAALRLASAGLQVSVFDSHTAPGGKMRTVPSAAGPVDAGPTVLTLKPVFDALFADAGARLEDHVTLETEPLLARHFWPDGTTLDLFSDIQASVDTVSRTFGTTAAAEFRAFTARANRLFDAFEGPMMQAATPSLGALTRHTLRNPALIPQMAPHQTLSRMLARRFSDPRLAQLFARYATYVGGTPEQSPAILSLIWAAEQRGVWHVKGGMHRLAVAIADLAQANGASFHFDAHVTRIEMQDQQPVAIHTNGDRHPVDMVLFNGDPRALTQGALGDGITTAVSGQATEPRSLSAQVHAFAATVDDTVPLAAHNVFFAADPAREYHPLHKGKAQSDPTLYICAQDRFGGRKPVGQERFEIIMNAAPVGSGAAPDDNEVTKCQTLIFNRLRQFGLHFTPTPGPETLTGPAAFHQMFPHSAGSLYGRSPRGMMAAFHRPTARTAIKGLYLVGGGAHPGAGVPMATLSAAHAADAILNDLSLTSTSRPADTHGGMSMGSATMARAPFRS
ncbi:phytoene desaturase [Sulfitobacter sp. TSTF-M16]|uniref:Phytoene desaturase n=1 Tax=Sulfitobacter aestuariivivens TaxID=2766981 RepID=A0A927D4Y3_9RHOB|nr:phytoene desaturase [Sulfitobacter aestuariivivens]